MRVAAVVALMLAGLVACAVPVRPVARLVPDADGGAHFEADPTREPQIPVAGILGLVTSLIGGPWGTLLTAGVTLLGGAAVGHKVGHKRGKRAAQEPQLPNPPKPQ